MENQPDLWAGLSAPAKRALAQANIHTVADLAQWRESDLLTLHGLGPSALPKLRKLLDEYGLVLTPDEHALTAYLHELNHPLKDLVLVLREIIRATDASIGEQVKWNSPAFYYTGAMKPFDPKTYRRDIVVLNLHKPDVVLLVFPTGTRIPDPTGLFTGSFPDGRRTLNLRSVTEAYEKSQALQMVLRAWLDSIEK